MRPAARSRRAAQAQLALGSRDRWRGPRRVSARGRRARSRCANGTGTVCVGQRVGAPGTARPDGALRPVRARVQGLDARGLRCVLVRASQHALHPESPPSLRGHRLRVVGSGRQRCRSLDHRALGAGMGRRSVVRDRGRA